MISTSAMYITKLKFKKIKIKIPDLIGPGLKLVWF
jgi:hypothetical protein